MSRRKRMGEISVMYDEGRSRLVRDKMKDN